MMHKVVGIIVLIVYAQSCAMEQNNRQLKLINELKHLDQNVELLARMLLSPESYEKIIKPRASDDIQITFDYTRSFNSKHIAQAMLTIDAMRTDKNQKSLDKE